MWVSLILLVEVLTRTKTDLWKRGTRLATVVGLEPQYQLFPSLQPASLPADLDSPASAVTWANSLKSISLSLHICRHTHIYTHVCVCVCIHPHSHTHIHTIYPTDSISLGNRDCYNHIKTWNLKTNFHGPENPTRPQTGRLPLSCQSE